MTIDGEPGLFVTGDEHFVMFLDVNGAIRDELTYLAGTVLLWNRGPMLLRLEGDMTLRRGGRARQVGRVGNRCATVRCIRIVTPLWRTA